MKASRTTLQGWRRQPPTPNGGPRRRSRAGAGDAGNAEVPVDQDEAGRQVESRERIAHRGPRRLQHVDHVDLPRSDAADREGERVRADLPREPPPLSPGEELESRSPSMGVVGSRMTAAPRRGRPGGRARPRPRPPPRDPAPRHRAPGRRGPPRARTALSGGTGAALAHSGPRPRDCRPSAGGSRTSSRGYSSLAVVVAALAGATRSCRFSRSRAAFPLRARR